MSHEADVLAFLEALPGTKLHQVDIIGGLPHIGPSAVDAILRSLAKRDLVTKVSKAVYQHKDLEAIAPMWENTNATHATRINALLVARGPLSERAIQHACPDIRGLNSVLFALGQGGHVHNKGDKVWAVGVNPRAPVGPRKPINSMGVHRGWDERRAPITPVEAVEPREASADATSEKPTEARADVCAGDAPDESAAGKTPAPEISPAPASDIPWVGGGGQFDNIDDLIKANAGPIQINRIPTIQIIPPMEADMTDTDTKEPAVGEKAQAATDMPTAVFRVDMPGLCIDIHGEAKAVMQAVAAIEKTLA